MNEKIELSIGETITFGGKRFKCVADNKKAKCQRRHVKWSKGEKRSFCKLVAAGVCKNCDLKRCDLSFACFRWERSDKKDVRFKALYQ